MVFRELAFNSAVPKVPPSLVKRCKNLSLLLLILWGVSGSQHWPFKTGI